MFVSFEGIDGSGKSTQLSMLRAVLEQEGHSVCVVREPGATVLSEDIRTLLLSNKHSISPISELLLFSAARAQLVEKVITPALQAHSIVLCDRYMDSTTAYQGFGRGLEAGAVQACNQIATAGVVPSLTFFIDVPFEQAQQRMQFSAAEPDRMERAGAAFFERVRQGYHSIARTERHRFVVIDGMVDRHNIHQKILSVFRSYFNGSRF
jgi:dTMP kinase